MEMVNGFQCKDCTDVSYAKRFVDPTHTKDGPFGINAPTGAHQVSGLEQPSVILGGELASTSNKNIRQDQLQTQQRANQGYGGVVDITA